MATSFAQEKIKELPPLQPRNIVDSAIKKFLNDNLEKSTSTHKKVISRDLLGRTVKSVKSQNLYYIGKDDEQRMDVSITDIDYRETNKSTVTGRFKIDKNGAVDLWLNGEFTPFPTLETLWENHFFHRQE